MIRPGRLGLVVALAIALGVGADLHSGVGHADGDHGCDRPWDPSADSDVAQSPDGKVTEVYDDFDGPAGAPPDPAKWTVVEGKNWDRGAQTYRRDNAVLDGEGHLELRADKTAGGYVSGRVETRRKWSFGYGTLIARMKMPSGQGLWPGFWLIGADEDVNPWPGAGEIDVLEQVSDPRTRYSSLHGPIDNVKDYLQAQIVGHGPDLSENFHDYWVIRKKNLIMVGVDNDVWGTFVPSSLPPTAEWVYNKPFCLIMSLAVGGEWPGPPDDSTPFPSAMLIDWVHWQPA